MLTEIVFPSLIIVPANGEVTKSNISRVAMLPTYVCMVHGWTLVKIWAGTTEGKILEAKNLKGMVWYPVEMEMVWPGMNVFLKVENPSDDERAEPIASLVGQVIQ